MNEQKLREIPSVNEVLEQCLKFDWSIAFQREQILSAIREELSSLRQSVMDGKEGGASNLIENVHNRLKEAESYSLRTVINATGIIVHTNLGRAPLSLEAARHMMEIATSYSNLEFDLQSGHRGAREIHTEKFLKQLLPVEASLIVNNNAAALLLILNSLAEGKEVIVSRGELIEIGGSFRLPEIMKKSGAILKEVGATNKTRISDYQKGINENSAMILCVHPSNYQIIGFTEKPQLIELAALAKKHRLPLVQDQGSGILVELESMGIKDEPTVIRDTKQGADLICFSGDKILGGPQTGIICGKKIYMDKLRNNPLFRALRVDKTIYAAMEATLSLYLRNRTPLIPVLAMLSYGAEDLQKRGTVWLSALQSAYPSLTFTLESTLCYVGGGVAPMKELPSFAIALSSSSRDSNQIASALRSLDPPIIARIESDRVLFELRTINVAEQEIIENALKRFVS